MIAIVMFGIRACDLVEVMRDCRRINSAVVAERKAKEWHRCM